MPYPQKRAIQNCDQEALGVGKNVGEVRRMENPFIKTTSKETANASHNLTPNKRQQHETNDLN